MAGQTPNNPGLWTPEPAGYGTSPTEKTVLSTIQELQELKPFDAVQKSLAQAAVALAVNIDKGNTKGRAIANEVMQLSALLTQLQGLDAGPDESPLPPELRSLLDVLAMRQSPIPWQRYVADVATEVDERGQFVYPIVLVLVQRQSGKTTLAGAKNIENCLQSPDRRAWYTAQTGQHASDRWLEMVRLFTSSPLARLAHARLSNGAQSLQFVNGSTLRPHPPTEDSLHSKQSDVNDIDEGWYFTEAHGQALLQAITPTTTTRLYATGQRPQLWVWSTEGTIESTWLNALIARARAGDPAIAFFDWGIGPDVDPTDLPAVAAAHPGFGHLFGMETLVDAAAQLPPGEFARAYGNRRTGATERVIPAEPWNAARTLDALPDGVVGFGAAVGVDGVDTSIVAAVRRGRDVVVEVVDHLPGTHWGLDRVVELQAKHGGAFAIDNRGPSASLHDQAERADVALIPMNTAAVTAACQNVLTWISQPQPQFRFRPHPALDDAAELATRRWVSDGAWVWGRRQSVGSIAALEAATNAAWAVDHMPQQVGLQMF